MEFNLTCWLLLALYCITLRANSIYLVQNAKLEFLDKISSVCTFADAPVHADVMELPDEEHMQIEVVEPDGFVTLEEFKEQVADELSGSKSEDDDYSFSKIPTHVEVADTDGGLRTNSNYASLDAGATILDTSDGAKSASNILVRDKDRYMLMPREQAKKWIVISLSEDVHPETIVLSNFERFSSRILDFWVLGSVNYPTDKWVMLGNFTAENKYGVQKFDIPEKHHVRYIKLRITSTYGTEYFCTLSQFQVFGSTLTEVISQLERSFTDEASTHRPSADVLETKPAQVEVNHKNDTIGRHVCTFYSTTDLYTAVAWARKYPSLNNVCPNLYTGDRISIPMDCKCKTHIGPDENIVNTKLVMNETLIRDDDNDSRVIEVEIFPDANVTLSGGNHSTPSAAKNNSSVSIASNDENIQSINNITAAKHDESGDIGNNSSHPGHIAGGSEAVGQSNQTTSDPEANKGKFVYGHKSTVPPLQNLFKAISKRLHSVEANQSIFDRYLNEINLRYQTAIGQLQKEQSQLIEIIEHLDKQIIDLKEKIESDSASHSLVDEKQAGITASTARENLYLREEVLLIRHIIVSLEYGIFMSIGSSVFIILCFLCREGLRRRRRSNSNKHSNKPRAIIINKPALTLSDASYPIIDRSVRFGTSIDDFAIQRSTMYSRLLSQSRGFRHHHVNSNK